MCRRASSGHRIQAKRQEGKLEEMAWVLARAWGILVTDAMCKYLCMWRTIPEIVGPSANRLGGYWLSSWSLSLSARTHVCQLITAKSWTEGTVCWGPTDYLKNTILASVHSSGVSPLRSQASVRYMEETAVRSWPELLEVR